MLGCMGGNAWVSVDAKVFGNARVYGDAKVFGNARVFGDARVLGNARVYGDAKVLGNARYRDWETDRKSTRLNSSHITRSRMPSSA